MNKLIVVGLFGMVLTLAYLYDVERKKEEFFEVQNHKLHVENQQMNADVFEAQVQDTILRMLDMMLRDMEAKRDNKG